MNIIRTTIFYISSFLLAISPTTKFTEGVTGQPRNFFPHRAETQTDRTISALVYRGLFKYDIYGALVPDLAESWGISDGGLVYTIKLKKDVFWSDGTRINSDDLIYTAFKSDNLAGIATDKVDNRTVRYTLPNKFSPFLDLLTIGVMQANSEENYDPLTPVTNGKFRIVRIKRSGPIVKEVVLVNSAPYEGFRKLAFRYYSNDEEIETAAALGEVDGFISSMDMDLENFERRDFPVQGVYYGLFFNLENEKFQDIDVRKKLEKVLPMESITFNYGISVEGPISRNIFTDEDLDFDKYDETFSDDLAEIPVIMTIPDLEQHESVSNQVKNYWESALDLDVKIRKINAENISKEVIENRDFEILLFGQEVSRDPGRYIYWHSTQTKHPGLNITGFSHVRADRALEEGRNELDNKDRLVHYNEFQRVIVDNVPVIFLYHPYAKYYVSNYVEGIGEKYTFSLSDRFLDFENWSEVETN